MSGGRRFSLRRQKAVLDRIVAAHPEGITRLKVRNLLYLIDLQAYLHLGKSITGASYRRGKRSPIVQGLTRSIGQLRDEGRITYGKPPQAPEPPATPSEGSRT